MFSLGGGIPHIGICDGGIRLSVFNQHLSSLSFTLDLVNTAKTEKSQPQIIFLLAIYFKTGGKIQRCKLAYTTQGVN